MNTLRSMTHTLAAAGLLTTVVPAFADNAAPLTANVGITSDYVFRGVSQTQGGPAIQGGIDYAHPSGFYVGTWASNVSWVSVRSFKDSNGTVTTGDPFKENNSMEWDFYGGYKASAGDFGYDLGVITYYYPGNKTAGAKSPDTTEVYLGGSWKFLSVKYSHVVSENFIGWYDFTNNRNTRGSHYLELNANYDLGGGWGVLGHVGHQTVKHVGDASYTDWKVGVSKDVGFGVITLAYTDTNAKDWAYDWSTSANGTDFKKVADGRAFVSFTKSF
ncbi:TorF family putative porin [Thiobacter aerophilum]|uniref:TorF family putative porin n=1 Tax=Thiobacter aerophilum TaxID=3121275 RepID=A0ABV0ED34_9BURK